LADDREVWKRISRGDVDAFDGFYRANAPRLRSFLHQVTGNRQAAEDLTQETFLQMWTQPNGFDPDRGNLRAYLFGIGRKRASEWWRRQRPGEPELEETPEASQSELHAMLEDALVRIPPQQRALLWLREVEGQSYGELAAILEIPVGTVRSRLFAAREALRKIWRVPGESNGGQNELR